MRVSPEFYKLMRTLKCEPYKLEKNELMMVYEHRPDTREFLETIIEECEERFAGKEHLLDEILGHIKETLGPCATKEEGDAFKAKQDALDDEEEAQPSEAERELRKEVEREDAAEVRQAEIDWALRPTVIRKQDLPNKIKLNPEFDDDPEAPIHMCLNDLTLEEKIEAAIWIDGTPFKGLPYVPNPPKETQREVLPWTARQAMTGGEHLEPIPALPEHISRANYKKDMKKKGNK